MATREEKCSRTSLTEHAALCVVFVGVLRSGEHWADVRRRKCLAHIWEQWLLLGPLGSVASLLSNPEAPHFFSWSPLDQTVGTGLSKAISSQTEDHTGMLWSSLRARKGDKKALCFDFKDQFVRSAVYCLTLHLSTFKNVSYLQTSHEQHWALREACSRTYTMFQHALDVSWNRRVENTKQWRHESMKTM